MIKHLKLINFEPFEFICLRNSKGRSIPIMEQSSDLKDARDAKFKLPQ